MNWDERTVLFALHETPGIGLKTIQKLNTSKRHWLDCLAYTPEEWRAAGVTASQLGGLANGLSSEYVQMRLAAYRRNGIEWLTPLDDKYPDRLKEIPDAPWVLYCKGRLELLQGFHIAIVGTRRPTYYGKRMTIKFAEELSAAGITVVSGLARGIDGCAHEGALGGIGGTIAVLGGPIGTVYPPEHRGLYHRIEQSGLLVSEYPLGMAIKQGHFPLRNRIIAGLSCAAVVMEADERSGSLITADTALGYNREVYCLPGPADTDRSRGTNRYIREQRAQLVTEPGQVLSDLRFILGNHALPELPEGEAGRDTAHIAETGSLSEAELSVLALLADGPMRADDICEATGLPFGLLHSVLINLTIKRKIAQHPGSVYSKS